MGIYGFWQRYCGSCGFDWDEARAWGLIVFPSEWKAVSLSGPVCQGTNCRNNVGKRALAKRPVFQGVFSAGVDRVEGEREVLQDKHATGAEIIKTLLSLLACKTLDLSMLFQVWFFFFVVNVNIRPDWWWLIRTPHHSMWLDTSQGAYVILPDSMNSAWGSMCPDCEREAQQEFSGLTLASPPINLFRTRKMQLVQLIVAQKADWVLLNSEAGSNFYVICCEDHQSSTAGGWEFYCTVRTMSQGMNVNTDC